MIRTVLVYTGLAVLIHYQFREIPSPGPGVEKYFTTLWPSSTLQSFYIIHLSIKTHKLHLSQSSSAGLWWKNVAVLGVVVNMCVPAMGVPQKSNIVWRACGKQSMGPTLRQSLSTQSGVNQGICLEQR